MKKNAFITKNAKVINTLTLVIIINFNRQKSLYNIFPSDFKQLI